MRLRGDSIKSLADGMLGLAGSDYWASIGGYIYNGDYKDGSAPLSQKSRKASDRS